MFQKVGSPQPLEVMPEMCQQCGVNKAEFNVGGKMLCSTCKPPEEVETVPEQK